MSLTAIGSAVKPIITQLGGAAGGAGVAGPASTNPVPAGLAKPLQEFGHSMKDLFEKASAVSSSNPTSAAGGTTSAAGGNSAAGGAKKGKKKKKGGLGKMLKGLLQKLMPMLQKLMPMLEKLTGMLGGATGQPALPTSTTQQS